MQFFELVRLFSELDINRMNFSKKEINTIHRDAETCKTG